MCSGRIAYGISGYEETDPPDLAAYWRFGLGTAVHDMWQPIILKVFEDTPKGYPRNQISHRTTTIKPRANPKLAPALFRYTVPES